MTLKQTERLLKLLTAHGVTHYKALDLEVEMGSSIPARMPTPPPEPPSLPPAAPTPTSPTKPLAPVPVTDSKIPHEVNKVQALLKLSDSELVDALFPEPK